MISFRKLRHIRILAKLIIIVVLLAILGIYHLKNGKKKIDVQPAKIERISTMVRLSSMDIYNEVPVVDTINNKVICAIQKQKGSISFDVEKLRIDSLGDTIRITLPHEIVELYESTEPNAWKVIDTKPIGPLALIQTGKLTNREENQVKARIAAKSKRELYRNGTVRRARTEAAANLRSFAEKLYRKPVIVIEN